jgi:glycosyltransferase involved in cell wall biosynthesis
MKIAQVNVYFYPVMVGGAEWYVRNVSRELVKRGHEVHVFTVDKYQGEKIGPSEDVVDGVFVHRIPLRLDLTYRAKIWKGLKERLITGNFDIIHTYDYGQPHSYVAVKAGKTIEKPAALTVFDVHSLIPRPFYKRVFMKIFDRYIARFTLKKASKVLVRAPNLVDPLRGIGVSKEKICVTPSGINEEALRPGDSAAFLEKYGISGNPVILYLGRLHPVKGPQHLIMAAPAILAAYPNAVFVFVGPDQKGFKSKLVEMGEQYEVGDRFVFTGPIYDFKVKMGAYAAADVFVLPSGYEGTSQAIFEAMAQARPIVATNRGGIPFQVEDGKEAILVEYGNVTSIATVILRLLDNRKLSESLGERAKEKVKNFTYPVLVDQLEEIYRDILKM